MFYGFFQEWTLKFFCLLVYIVSMMIYINLCMLGIPIFHILHLGKTDMRLAWILNSPNVLHTEIIKKNVLDGNISKIIP